MTSAADSGGTASSSCTEVQIIVQTKNGTLRSVMPGARMPPIVARKLTPAEMLPKPLIKQSQRPQVGGRAAGEGPLGERRIGEPADCRRAAGGKAEIDEQAAEERRPEAERVEPRKGHVAGADHQRHEVIAQADQNRHADEEDHRRAVHREELVERVGRQERARACHSCQRMSSASQPPTTRNTRLNRM